MKNFLRTILVVALLSTASLAAAKDALFVNMTSNDAHRADMATRLPLRMLKMGHPVTIFLNDKGIFLATKSAGAELENAQKNINELVKNGAKVLVCPYCLEYYKVNAKDLINGVEISEPKKLDSALFTNNTQTLSW